MPKPYYITTAIPYVNAKPHLGHAYEFVFADIAARYKREKEGEVLLLSGSDENALKNVEAAEKAGKDIVLFINEYTEFFIALAKDLGVEINVFQRGSDENHHKASQKLWELCRAAGDIYRKKYEGLYCVGCEAFYTPDELNDAGECFEHPGKKLDMVAEENYFFRLSRYRDELVKLIFSDALCVAPETRKNEVLSFLSGELQDISISRSNERAKNWGVEVPGDPAQRIYVWFDALNIYQSGVGFGWDEKMYQKWWPADVHLIGKGIIRFHAVYWPAFLLSAKLPLPKKIMAHGYLTVGGQKMSKTLGNVIGPDELIRRFGKEAARYLLIASLPNGLDADVNLDRLWEKYQADLANGIGNLASRITTLAVSAEGVKLAPAGELKEKIIVVRKKYEDAMESLDFYAAIAAIQELVKRSDRYLNETAPWKLEGEEKRKTLSGLSAALYEIAAALTPLMSETAKNIFNALGLEGKLSYPAGAEVRAKKIAPLFPRI